MAETLTKYFSPVVCERFVSLMNTLLGKFCLHVLRFLGKIINIAIVRQVFDERFLKMNSQAAITKIQNRIILQICEEKFCLHEMKLLHFKR